LNDHATDFQYTFGASGANPRAGDKTANFFNRDDPGGYAGIITILTPAFSRGTIHILSDALIPSLIDPRYVTNLVDGEVVAPSMRVMAPKILEW
jgi:choline dehydrogenase